ncbi:ArsR/SmtB family transcription factor [Andreprevotia chitinilytica]|uniref:ArsR/SmtB family transcription factor n=1 Tax=Andreprevotia chitinilytica TaxID=396808 RepID=UPI000551CBC5|nr:metalloregulator ArsR/SmtB family transcription factor [Andreprevotia chitinilytica]
MENKTATTLLAALAQETRLAVYRLLVTAGPEGMQTGKIGEALELAPATLSFHLKELTRAGLIVDRKESRYIYYAARYDTMNALIDFLTENCCGGEPCMPVKIGSDTCC